MAYQIISGQGGIAVPARITVPDLFTVLHYTLDESATPWANTGQAGVLNAAVVNGAVRRAAATGLFSGALDLSACDFATANTAVGEVAQNFTMSAWVFPFAFTKTFADIFMKQYRGDNTWTTPFESLGLELGNATDGTWAFNWAIAATAAAITITAPEDKLQVQQWQHLAATYDGANMRAYRNGNLVGSAAATGNIDYGTHGRWVIGGNPANTPNQQWHGLIDDCRFENTVRTPAYLQQQYMFGMGLFQ